MFRVSLKQLEAPTGEPSLAHLQKFMWEPFYTHLVFPGGPW